MATPRATTYTAESGGGVFAGIPNLLPAWRTALAPWQWFELAGTSLSLTVPDPQPTGNPAYRIEAYNGFAVMGTKLVMAGAGGHFDWAGNEGYSNDIGVATPGAWNLLNAPTPVAQYLSDTNHYADGRPTSSHVYYSLQPDMVRNKLFRLGVGSGWGTGNWITPCVDAFDFNTNDWDAAGTWPDVPASPGTSKGTCRDPLTGDFYVPAGGRLYRSNQSDRSWTALADFPFGSNETAAQARALVFDSNRRKVIVVGNAYNTPTGALSYDVATNVWSALALTGSRAADVAAPIANGAFFLPGADRIVVRRKFSGGEILLVDPVSGAVTEQATTGGSSIPATNFDPGVMGLFQGMPALGGGVFVPLGSSNIYFLATPV